jgi:glycosyltransferase involved in cell wall biosynthesis
MNAPMVTVAIPFFNNQVTIAYAIESVLAQTFTDFELLLVNDGSADGSVEAVRPYVDGQRVRLFNDGRNLGLSARLNQIAQLANGAFLARMDADDVMHPARIEKQIRFLTCHLDIDVLGTDIYLVDSTYRVIERRRTPAKALSKRFTYLRLFHPTITGRTTWFRDNPYSAEFPRCEDLDLWMRTGGGLNISFIPEPLLYYNRFGTRNVSKIASSLRDHRRVLTKYRSKIGLRSYLLGMSKSIVGTMVYRIVGVAPILWNAFPQSAIPKVELASAQGLLDSIVFHAKTRIPSLPNSGTLCTVPSGPRVIAERGAEIRSRACP